MAMAHGRACSASVEGFEARATLCRRFRSVFAVVRWTGTGRARSGRTPRAGVCCCMSGPRRSAAVRRAPTCRVVYWAITQQATGLFYVLLLDVNRSPNDDEKLKKWI